MPDLVDIVVTRIFTDAQRAGREARMQGLRDLDIAALTLRQGWSLLLEQGEVDPRARRYSPVPELLCASHRLLREVLVT